MKIAIFAYNFSHEKTYHGLITLFLHNYTPTLILAQDKKNLNIPTPSIRITPKNLYYEHPSLLAERLRIKYVVCDHNSETAKKQIQLHKPDLGVILGARKIDESIIKLFKTGIINIHPGILPDNRGLDNIKWAIAKKQRLACTSHIIDKNLDLGKEIISEIIHIYKDDTLLDIYIRMQNHQMKLLIDSLKEISLQNLKTTDFEKLKGGTYNKPMTNLEESKLPQQFEEYKKIFAVIE